MSHDFKSHSTENCATVKEVEVTTADNSKQEEMITISWHDVTDMTEWHIPISGGAASGTTEFRNSDFRNSQTGESILPTDLYVELVRSIEKASGVAKWKLVTFIGLYLSIALLPYLVNNSDASYDPLFWTTLFIISLYVGIETGLVGINWTYQSCDLCIHNIVEERIAFFSQYGIEMGYYPKIESRSWYDSHVWLRRQPQEDSTHTSLSTSQEFPSIYLHMLVPGEIHIGEKEYHPSMIMDLQTWTIIQNVHFATVKYHNCLSMTILLFGIMTYFYAIFISLFTRLLGNPLLLLLAFMTILIVAWFTLDRLRMNSYRKVTEQVNQMLLNSEDRTMAGYSLELVTTTVPFRSRQMSRRYQLIRRGESENISFTKEDQMDGNEHEIV